MGIPESIKAERRLSFDHWRYRVLHWCFGVKNPDPKHCGATGLPPYLYTHYCPLFHITNLIVVLSPLVLLIKGLAVVAVGAERLLRGLVRWYSVLRPATVVSDWQRERKQFIRILCDNVGVGFEVLWKCVEASYDALSKEECLEIYEELMPRLVAEKERAERRRQRLRERIIFWGNFSRVAFKWGMGAAYLGLTVGACYLLSLLYQPFLDFFRIVADLFTWDAFAFVGKLFVGGATVGFFMWASLRLRLSQTVLAVAARVAMPPARLAGLGLCRLFDLAFAACCAVCEFVSVYYAENCPPITIVTGDEPEDV